MVAWQHTDQSQATMQKPFLGASASMLETQATERLYKDAPPGIPIIIFVSDFVLFTSLINP